jgi:hypothetical protein
VPALLEDLRLVDTGWRRGQGVTSALVGAVLIELGDAAMAVAGRLSHGAATADELVNVTGLPVAAVLAALTMLEARGLVVGVYGRYRPIGALASADGRPKPIR